MQEQHILGYIGQLNSMQDGVEPELTEEEYHDFCDQAASLIAYLRLIRKRNAEISETSD